MRHKWVPATAAPSRLEVPRYDGKTDHFFNESGSFDDPHSHVVESKSSTLNATKYDYARDVDGNEYGSPLPPPLPPIIN
jgi:hypothetical protein